MLEIPPAFNTLALYNQFILWIAVPSKSRPGKVDKFPVHPKTLKVSDAHDPAIWISAHEAVHLAAVHQFGVGFVFTENDPFFFLDIDECLQADGQWSPVALSLCAAFEGAAIEVSHSGKGLHVIGQGAVSEHGCRNKHFGLEFYTSGRFVALTGAGMAGDSSTVCSNLPWLVDNYFPPSEFEAATEWTEEPCDEWSGPDDDDALIAKMLKSRSAAGAFGGRASIADLWHVNEDILGSNYPDDGPRAFNHSDADMALCVHLAFWTGKDCARMDRLFRQSGLMRDKWEDRDDYGPITIMKAVGLCSAVYGAPRDSVEPAKPESIDTAPAYREGFQYLAAPAYREGFQYLAAPQQSELFAGCVYVRDYHRVFTPDGGLLKPDQFKATYGGYVFALDAINDKVTKNAWEVFTESQAVKFPRAHSVCFRPEEPTGAIVLEEGATIVNTYVEINTPRQAGDPSRFLNHVAKLLPDERDRAIILAYMAAIVQYPGKKFQWAPLIQGMEGNGKSLLMAVVSRAVGLRYTHKPNPKDIGNVFNAWIANKLFIAIEEVYTADRQDVIDTLKWLITDDRCPITPKGVDQVTGDNRANFMMSSNHKDAIRKTRGDRRYGVFFTAQQEPGDLERDGMGGSYFPDIYEWLRGGGYAVVNDFLRSYAIPVELNPAGALHRAPTTSSTEEAFDVSLGGVEQEVLEAIDEGRPGFANGWISSMAFDRLLEVRRDSRKIPVNKRRGVLQSLGYDLHPGLSRGRVNNIIPMDNGKPRLYIKAGHLSANLTKPADIAKAYIEAQQTPTDVQAAAVSVMVDR